MPRLVVDHGSFQAETIQTSFDRVGAANILPLPPRARRVRSRGTVTRSNASAFERSAMQKRNKSNFFSRINRPSFEHGVHIALVHSAVQHGTLKITSHSTHSDWHRRDVLALFNNWRRAVTCRFSWSGRGVQGRRQDDRAWRREGLRRAGRALQLHQNGNGQGWVDRPSFAMPAPN